MVDDVDLTTASMPVLNSKNKSMMSVYLPPVLVAGLANHPRGLTRKGAKLFRFTKCGRLYALHKKVISKAGSDLRFVTFHVLRHTYATWMRTYGGADLKALVATARWKDEASATRYQHVIPSTESRRAELLPVENTWKDDLNDAKENKINA